MAITLMCPNLRCRKTLMVPDNSRGTRVRCSYCGMMLVVPLARQVVPKRMARSETPVGTEANLGKKGKGKGDK